MEFSQIQFPDFFVNFPNLIFPTLGINWLINNFYFIIIFLEFEFQEIVFRENHICENLVDKTLKALDTSF